MRMPVMSRRDPYQPIKRTSNNVWFQSTRFQICYCSIKEKKKKKHLSLQQVLTRPYMIWPKSFHYPCSLHSSHSLPWRLMWIPTSGPLHLICPPWQWLLVFTKPHSWLHSLFKCHLIREALPTPYQKQHLLPPPALDLFLYVCVLGLRFSFIRHAPLC